MQENVLKELEDSYKHSREAQGEVNPAQYFTLIEIFCSGSR